MGIAIRLDATKTSLKRTVDRYTREGRPAVRVTCPVAKCEQVYIVYHGPSLGEADLREGLAPYLTRDHPKHPLLYEVDESTPDDLKKMGAMDATPLYQPFQAASTKVRDVMTEHPVCCVPSDTVQHVASLMRDKDVGSLPVVEDHNLRRLLGIITDRDVCCRATADGHDPRETPIAHYITRNLITCLADDDLKHCLELLHRYGIRRMPVVDNAGQCIGIVAPPDIPEPAKIVVRREFAKALRSTLQKHVP